MTLREALAPALLAGLLASCSAFGTIIREGGAASGAAVGSLAGPGGAAAGAVLGGMAGELAAKSATGTQSLRVPVPAAHEVTEVALPMPGSGASQPMTLEFVIVGLVLAGAIRELWSLKKRDAEQQKQLDELWDRIVGK